MQVYRVPNLKELTRVYGNVINKKFSIFNGHLGLIIEMFEWMLTPKFIARRKKIKSNLDFFPYRVKEFIKDNIYFYEQLYISIHNCKLPFSLCFNFLRTEFFDKETTDTALGYFA